MLARITAGASLTVATGQLSKGYPPMKTVTVTVQIQVTYDDKFTSLTEVETALTERATAFLYPVHMNVKSATVARRRRSV